MTGGELAGAAAKAVENLAEHAAIERRAVKAELLNAAKDSPELADAARTYAKRLAVKQRILLKLYEPLAKRVGVAQEYFEEEFAKDLSVKLAEVPDEDLVTPKPSVAAPALHGLGLVFDDTSLKELYLNLLATASNRRRNPGVHPSFAEVIRQLASDEAELLASVLGTPLRTSIVRINLVNGGEPKGSSLLQNHVIPWQEDGEAAVPAFGATYVDNWVRLALVRAEYNEWLVRAGAYDWVETRPEVEMLKRSHEHGGNRVDWDRGYVVRTNFGEQFGRAVGVIQN